MLELNNGGGPIPTLFIKDKYVGRSMLNLLAPI